MGAPDVVPYEFARVDLLRGEEAAALDGRNPQLDLGVQSPVDVAVGLLGLDVAARGHLGVSDEPGVGIAAAMRGT